VRVAAPSLQRDLHVSDAALQLIVGGYAFMYASGMVTGGRPGDLFGYRRLFMIGVVSFAAASLLCGLAQSSTELVAARLVQGLTGAAMVPQVLALITATFPVGERSRALAWFGVTMGVGFVSGQILGGGLIEANIFGLGQHRPGPGAADTRPRPGLAAVDLGVARRRAADAGADRGLGAATGPPER
jgi:MFS family permease